MRPPLFIVAAPRSYTSVVGGMLGQHPQAYGLPEVNLSHADTLGELWSGYLVQINFGTAGFLRLLAQLHEGEQTEDGIRRARAWIEDRRDWTATQVWDHLQERIGPDRMMVEKSPRNTFHADNLRRLLRIFPNANFLHLIRHPRSHGKSVLDLMKTQGNGQAFNDPEETWLNIQSNVLELRAELPPGQYMRIKGEMLLSDPKFYLRQICQWLDLDDGDDAIEAMLHPENSPYARIGPPSAKFGNDPNFLENPKLDFERLARIKEGSLEGEIAWKPGQEFRKETLHLARQFGYS